MLIFLILITVLAHMILPFIFLRWVAFNKGKNKLYRISVFIFVGAYLITMWIAGAGWHWFGIWWPRLFLFIFALAAILFFKKLNQVQWFPEKKFLPWFNTVIMVVLAIMFTMGLPDVFTAKKYEGEVLKLKFPLRNGTYHVGHGGGSESMNHHYEVKAQKYALDILKVNKWGVRAKGFMPKELEAYEIFGDKIVAPCSGEVVSVENELTDNFPLQMDPENLLGNHVILFCRGYSVLLAHLKKNSLPLKIGDHVEEGSLLGEVGNTGNTSEPHLHIHAVKGKITEKKEIAGTAEGVPMLFEDKFLIRNDQVTYID